LEKNIPAKLHVLTLTPFYPSDGDEVRGCFVAETLREIERLGASSTVIAVDSIYHRSRKANTRFPAQWIRYPHLPGNFGLSTAGWFLASSLSRRIEQIHGHSPIHAIHAHAALPCGHAAAILSRRLGIPFIVTIHGLDVFNNCFKQGTAARWRNQRSREVYQRAKVVVCISQKIQRLLNDGMSEKVAAEVVYNGTDTKLFSPANESKDLQGEDLPRARAAKILIVGNLLAGKGHELLLKAVAQIKDSHPGIECDLIGEGADRERFAQVAEQLGIASQVHFLGRRSRAEVAEAMRQCTIFVLPSRYEGLGCVYLEAMASGKVAIGCYGQGIDEIIRHGENGWLILVDGVTELVEGLKTLVADNNLRSRIGETARKTILSGLTLSHQAEKLMSIYERAAR
jgi:teichuronic acid biosynthesis glycosyltransferase TuaC